MHRLGRWHQLARGLGHRACPAMPAGFPTSTLVLAATRGRKGAQLSRTRSGPRRREARPQAAAEHAAAASAPHPSSSLPEARRGRASPALSRQGGGAPPPTPKRGGEQPLRRKGSRPAGICDLARRGEWEIRGGGGRICGGGRGR
uniref:Uncharacterized protein n=1 Tax=Arundo donax TaxID=35708 RepID=A0A0A9DW81_ARUDO